MFNWSTIPNPSPAASNEDDYYKGKWNLNEDDLKKEYYELSSKKICGKRFVYKIVLLPDKNVFFVFVGSLASLPINILTGTEHTTWIFYIRLVLSLLFYYFFFRFALIANGVREEGTQYYENGGPLDLLPRARRNVEFAACFKNFKQIAKWLILSLIFLGLSIAALFISNDSLKAFSIHVFECLKMLLRSFCLK